MTRIAASTFFLFLLSIYLLTAPQVNASTESNVSVKTTTNYSNTSVTESHSKSKVTITCDGKTYTYESEGNINEHPCDGASVDINNSSSVSTTPNPTDVKKQIDDKKEEIKKKVDEATQKIKATITAMPKENPKPPLRFDIGSWLRSLFSSIFK